MKNLLRKLINSNFVKVVGWAARIFGSIWLITRICAWLSSDSSINVIFGIIFAVILGYLWVETFIKLVKKT